VARGTYGVTQGPRLETAAEIDRLGRDGCTIVGMTAMPEAALAREAGLPYALLCVSVNAAAGRGVPGESIHASMAAALAGGMDRMSRVLVALAAGPAG
jgi:purine nucleoside phosphorylase